MTINAIVSRLQSVLALPVIRSVVLLVFSLVLSAVSLSAQEDYHVDIQVSNSSPAVNEQFQVDYILKFKGHSGSFNLSGMQVKPPSFEGFRVVNQGGRMDMNMNFGFRSPSEDMSLYRYSFVLEATSKGKHEIEPFAFIWQGSTLESGTLTITVTERGAPGRPSQPQRPEDQIGHEDLFARTIADKKEVFMGEPITVTHKVYSRNNITGLDIDRMPSYNGFWSEDVDLGRLQVERERLNGTVYYVVTLSQKVLYPQQAGTLTIGEFKPDVTIEVITTRPPRNRSEQIWYGNRVRVRKNVEKTISAPPLSVNVKPFPAENRPADFRDAAGTYQLHSRLSRDTLALNQGTNLKITLTGKGNIRMLEPPALDIPAPLEHYEPHIETQTTIQPDGVTGSRSFDYLIIPQATGNFTIPPVTFSYFDLTQQKYVTLKSEPVNIYVYKSDKQAVSSGMPFSRQEELQRLGTDILYIYSHPFNVHKKGKSLVSSWKYWLIIILLLSLIPAAFILRKKQKRLEADRGLLLTRKANKMAKKRLKHAQKLKAENQKQAFYEEIHRAFIQYLSHRFRIPPSQINEQGIEKTLIEKNISQSLVTRSIQLLDQCDFVRFAPGKNKPDTDTIYQNATQLIRDMEYESRKYS